MKATMEGNIPELKQEMLRNSTEKYNNLYIDNKYQLPKNQSMLLYSVADVQYVE